MSIRPSTWGIAALIGLVAFGVIWQATPVSRRAAEADIEAAAPASRSQRAPVLSTSGNAPAPSGRDRDHGAHVAGSVAVQEPVDSYERWALEQNLPAWTRLRLPEEAAELEPAFSTNPFFQVGDFNGDGIDDVALLVRHEASEAIGLLVFHRNGDAHRVGEAVGSEGDPTDLRAMRIWRVEPSGEEGRDQLYFSKPESSSGIVEFDGARYVWRWQGD